MAGKDVIRIYNQNTSVSCRERIPGYRIPPPTGALGLVPGARQLQRERERERERDSVLAAVNHLLAERRKSGPCSNVRRWGLAVGRPMPAARIHVATKREITAVCKTFVPAGRRLAVAPLVRAVRGTSRC